MEFKFGVCNLALANLRKKPDDRSELVSQLLFGETFKLLEKHSPSWIRIQCTHDDYIGYVDPKQINFISEVDYDEIACPQVFAMENAHASIDNDNFIPLTIGANLPNYDGLSFKMPFGKMLYSNQIIDHNTVKISGETIERIAKKYLQSPYLWGGRSPYGIDCSGLTQVIYKMVGISIPRDSNRQARKGRVVAFVESAQAGDLAFFMKDSNRIIHVGIVTSELNILHASGKVRIDKLDNHGIFNEDLNRYTHRLRVIKRFIK